METTDVLFVVKADANDYRSIIVMCSFDWSLEKYEPERQEPGYIDPNTPDDPLYYGFPVYN